MRPWGCAEVPAAACITQQDHESECELATYVSFIHKIKVNSSTTALFQSSQTIITTENFRCPNKILSILSVYVEIAMHTCEKVLEDQRVCMNYGRHASW